MVIYVEFEQSPLGTDVGQPHFSWRSSGSEKGSDGKNLRSGYLQEGYRITVKDQDRNETVWDSGTVSSSCSSGILYEGKALQPRTVYEVSVETSGCGYSDSAKTCFETGLMPGRESISDTSAKEGVPGFGCAKWIGAPEKYLSADRLGVFALETDIEFQEGLKRAGIVFGADDERLKNKNRNIYGLSGENYIRYELDLSAEPKLLIFRVGYAKEDNTDVPFAEVKLPEEVLLPSDTAVSPVFRVRIEVTGNSASCSLNGVIVDEDRQLNPLGKNDVITFPRLNKIGYYVGAGSTAQFSGIRILNLREPAHEILHMDPEGLTLSGRTRAKAEEQQNSPQAEAREAALQLFKDPSAHSLPMFRRDFTVGSSAGNAGSAGNSGSTPDKASAKTLKKARLYITARGMYDARINGKPVTDTFLNPGLTEYDKRMNYQTYDVTELLNEGQNGIGITLGPAWWADAQTFVVRNVNYFGDREAFLLRLTLTYQDGTEEEIVSDPASWTYYGEGPYLYGSFFMGETLDGTRLSEYLDYSLPGCALISDKAPVELRTPETIHETRMAPVPFIREWPELSYENVRLQGSEQAPVHEICRLTAKTCFSPREGLMV